MKLNLKPKLRFNVTRKWGNRSLDINSKEWRKLRLQICQKYDYRCRFCDTKYNKYIICDHLDGDASNNDLSNLGLNCKFCDSIRHCGFSGMNGYLIARISKMDQIEIIRKTRDFYLEYKRWPEPIEIDPNSKLVQNFQIKHNGLPLLCCGPKSTSPFNTSILGDLLMKYQYSELENINMLRGFFTNKLPTNFIKYCSLSPNIPKGTCLID